VDRGVKRPGRAGPRRFHEKLASLPPIRGVPGNLGDDAEAFFRTGDEGTYEGGPASVIPFALCEELAEDLTVRVTDEQLERRRRLKRIVATLVGSLSAGLLFLFAWLLGVTAHATEVEGTRVPSRQPPHAAIAAPAPAPRTSIASSPQAVATATTETTTPDQPAERAKAPVATAQNTVADRRSRSFEAHTRRQAVAPPKRNVSQASASFGSSSSVLHSPPTANFPN
jgi:hypothetical protein